MGLVAVFIVGLTIALFVAFSRIGALERKLREFEESQRNLRTREPAAPSVPFAKPGELKLPAHLQPVPPLETIPQRPPAPEVDPAAERPPMPPIRHVPPPIPALARAEATPRATGPQPPLPDLSEQIRSLLKRLGPNDPDMSLEVALGSYWFPRVGALFLSVGAVLFLTLAMQRFGPGARVIGGYLAAAAFLGGAAALERKYPTYTRVLYGLGFALLYVVTFATYYFPPARIFDTPIVTLLMLAAIIGFFIGLAQYRRSPTIALVAILLGHTTIGIASFTLDEPGLYSGAGILVLSAGSAFFLLRDRWYAIAAVGMTGSYANHFLLMANSSSQGLVSEFSIGIGVLTGYFLIFALAERFSHAEVRKQIPTWFRTAFVGVNTACYFGLGTLLVESFEFTEDYHHVFRYALAIALLTLGVAYLRLRGRDPIQNAYLTKAAAALTLGLSAQFSGATLTATLAVQMVVLLTSARLSRLGVTRVLALAVAALTFLHGGFTALDAGVIHRVDPDYVSSLLQYALVVLGFFAAAQVYERTKWAERTPKTLPVSDALLDLLWDFDFVAEPSARRAGGRKFLDGLLFPYLYVLGGTILYLLFAGMLTEPGQRFSAFALAALVMAGGGRALASPPIACCALLAVAASLIAGSAEAFELQASHARLFAGAIPLLVLAFAAEPRLAGAHRSLSALQAVATPYFLHATPAWVMMLYITQLHDAPASFVLVAALAAYFAAISFVASPAATSYTATALLLFAHAFWYPYSDNPDARFHLASWLLIGLAAGGDRLFTYRNLAAAGPLLVLSAVALALRYAFVSSASDWVPVAWTAVAAIAAAYAGGFRSWAAAIGAGFAGVLASVDQVAIAYSDSQGIVPLTAGFLATASIWILGERIATHRNSDDLRPMQGVCVGTATLLLICLFERFTPLESVPLSARWGILGFAVFGIAVALRQKLYRYAGMGVVFLACARVFIDTRELDAIPRIASWLGVGAVMMVLAFFYVKVFAGDRSAPPKDPE